MGVQLLIAVPVTVVLVVVACRRDPLRWLGVLGATTAGASVSAAVVVAVRLLAGAASGPAAVVLGVAAGIGAGVTAGLLVRGAGRRPRPRIRLLAPTAAAVAIATGLAVAAVPVHTARAAAVPRTRSSTTPAATPTIAPVAWRVRTTSQGPGYRGITRWTVPTITDQQDVALAGWRSAGEPAGGRLGSVVIPGTRSHFPARPALLYLPPAALTRTPARLPVVVAFSGQSKGAAPSQLADSADLRGMIDRIAEAHGGVAPIVVVPDQLGPGSPNPMCVDGSLGHVATYVTQDVRSWILHHLPVETSRRGWTVAGFSEGGTCAIQFGAGDPQIFGSFVDVSGEMAPTNGSLSHTIAVGFHGSAAAYRAALPTALLAAHRPYRDSQAWFAVGALDRNYGPVEPVLRRRATAAGIGGGITVLKGLGHDWVTGAAGLAYGFDHLVPWWGLPTARA